MSNGYRGEHEALLARIAKLEEELSAARAEGVDGIRARLAELRASDTPPDRAAVTSLLERATELRRRLASSIAELEKLAESAAEVPAPAPAEATVTAAAAPPRPSTKALLFIIAAGLAALVAALAWPSNNGGRKLCKGDLDALMLERLAGRDCDPLLRVDATAFPDGPHGVAPTALVDVTRRSYLVPGEQLRGIDIPQVPPNGLVDFRTPDYLGVVSVHLAHHGGVFDFEGMHNGFEGDGELVPDPHCKVEDVWHAAAQAGVAAGPSERASLSYKALLPAGRAGWVFQAQGKTLLVDDATCQIATDLRVPPPVGRF